MKGLLVLCIAVLAVLTVVTCWPGPHGATGQEVMAGDPGAAPAATEEVAPDRYYRSYPAPTGAAGFRRYYQIRCYPGCHTGATPAVPAEASVDSVAMDQGSAERPYRSYPAPTGSPGFRRYYQIRCYPGCHSYPSATPDATRVHP